MQGKAEADPGTAGKKRPDITTTEIWGTCTRLGGYRDQLTD